MKNCKSCAPKDEDNAIEVKTKPPRPKPDALLGLFADDAEMMDQTIIWTMKARERR